MQPKFDLPLDTFHLRPVEPGEIIFLEGQPADKAYVILKGHVDVMVRDPHGNLVAVNRMMPGELFGEIALFSADQKRTATVMAADKCELLEIQRDVFDSRFAKADPLIKLVLDHLVNRLAKITDKFVSGGDK